MPRNLPVRDEQRLQAAVARGALTPARAEHWRVYAAAGHDISFVDRLVGGVVVPAAGTVAAAAPRDGAGYRAQSAQPEPEEAGIDEYHALFGSRQEGERTADAREVAARAAITALTNDQVYDALFGKVGAAAAPVTASAAGRTGQHGPGEAARKRYRVHAPLVSLRVPRSPDGLAVGAAAETSWRTIELRGGDLVPEEAHPADVERLRHQKNRLGPLIKPW